MQPMTGALLAVLAVATIVAVVCGIHWINHHKQNVIEPARSRLLLLLSSIFIITQNSCSFIINFDVTISFVMTTI